MLKNRGVKVLLAVVVILIAIRMFMGKPKALPEAFVGGTDLPTAKRAARESGMPVLAFVGADWCDPCTQLKSGALADADVATWIKDNTHAVYVDATKSNADTASLKVISIPALILIRVDGTGEREVARLTGLVDTKSLLAWFAENSGPVQDYKAKHGKFPPGYSAASPQSK